MEKMKPRNLIPTQRVGKIPLTLSSEREPLQSENKAVVHKLFSLAGLGQKAAFVTKPIPILCEGIKIKL
jgi:hypothetical protein